MKKTKIICTIGPASNDEKTIEKMIKAGMNVARLNFSHGNHESHKIEIENIKKVREKLGEPIAIMLDTKGPEFRIGKFEGGKACIKPNSEFTFTSKQVLGNEHIVSVSPKSIIPNLKKGDTILVANGLLSFKVLQEGKDEVKCKAISGGEMFDNKSMNFPDKIVVKDYLSNNDKNDLLFGIKNNIDLVACSFVSSAKDASDVRKFLNQNGGKDVDIIAKLENQSGIDNIDEILKIVDGIMIGRGDMGVEIPMERLPQIQKIIIKKCLQAGKTVITATEMLESMIKNPRPTRAEVSDVANAVYDGSSAIMLSGETAMGKYPVEAVATMSKIAIQTENDIDYTKRFEAKSSIKDNELDAVCRSAVRLSIDTGSKMLFACSKTGKTIKSISRYHAPCEVIGATTDKKVYYKLALCFGIIPEMVEDYPTISDLFEAITQIAKQKYNLKKGNNIVITGGIGKMTNTNLVKVERI